MSISSPVGTCLILASTLLCGCANNGTITTRLYALSSTSGKITYYAPTNCSGPSYWFSAVVHPGVTLTIAEGNLGWGPLITVNLAVPKDAEIVIDSPFELLDTTTGDRFTLSNFVLNMSAGPSPKFSYPAVLFGPGRVPALVKKEWIYENLGQYSYDATLPIPAPRRQYLRLAVPPMQLGQQRSSEVLLDFKDTSHSWWRSCYDFR